MIPLSELGGLLPTDGVEPQDHSEDFFSGYNSEDESLVGRTISDEEGGGSEHEEDEIFQSIQDQISRSESAAGSVGRPDSGFQMHTSDYFQQWQFGFIPRASYEHGKKSTDIMGVTYNGRTRQFVILDGKGITTWNKDAIQHQVSRALSYAKYVYRDITSLVYARKFNVYFALGKDFSLKVLNRDFVETCSVSADLRSVLFMIFNPLRDELITGGVGGTKIWQYRQMANTTWSVIKPMANYKLILKTELPNCGGSWVKKAVLDLVQENLYCCSETALYAYDLDGTKVFGIERAHAMSITGCVYSTEMRLLVTCSADSEVKVWNITGGLVHTFRGHSRAVSSMVIHPYYGSRIITSSKDGTVRMWCLETMEALHSVTASSDAIMWMGVTEEKLLWLCTKRQLTVWNVNPLTKFWALSRNRLQSMQLVRGEGKSTRLVGVGDDNSVRVFSRQGRKNLSTVLPPPCLSPMQTILGVAYNRVLSLVYVLISTKELWIYTTKTDPACRLAVWDLQEVQEQALLGMDNITEQPTSKSGPGSAMFGHKGPAPRATENGVGNEGVADVLCIGYLNGAAMVWSEEGFVCPAEHNFLLLGLEDGRVLFMDPLIKSFKHIDFKANKDPVFELCHVVSESRLITRCGGTSSMSFQVWSLPMLDLAHEVSCAKDITCFTCVNTMIVTGHKSGAVNVHPLVPAEEVIAIRPKSSSLSDISDDSRSTKTYEHLQAVVSVDSCPKHNIFLSCSLDGSVKIWDSDKALITDITMDSTLSSACFVSDNADVVIAFKNHIFHIDRTKVYPALEILYDEEEVDVESDVHEDPSVLYELGRIYEEEKPDVTLDSYLSPYSMEICNKLLAGKAPKTPPYVKRTKEEEEPEESEEDCFEPAPTDVYNSPSGTPPRSISMVDLSLGLDPDPLEIQEKLAELQRQQQQIQQPKVKRSKGKKLQFVEDVTALDQEVRLAFEMPRFGESPGPTPETSAPSTPNTPSEFSDSEDYRKKKKVPTATLR